MSVKGRLLDSANKALKASPAAKDSISLTELIKQTSAEVSDYRKQFMAKYPDNFLSILMHLMEEPKIPPAEQHPGENMTLPLLTGTLKIIIGMGSIFGMIASPAPRPVFLMIDLINTTITWSISTPIQ